MLFILILLVSLAAQFFLPWWIIAPIAFGLAAGNSQSGKKAFWNGFIAIFILWICMALVRSLPNENLLANRVGEMLTLPPSGFNWLILVFLTGLIGGLVAGVSAYAGLQFREAFLKKKRR